MRTLISTVIVGLLFTGALAAQEEFFDFGDEAAVDSMGPTVDFSGEISVDLRSYLDDGADSIVEFQAAPRLNLLVASDAAEAGLGLKALWIQPGQGPLEWQDFIDEARITWFFTGGFLEVGYANVEWGKGDGLSAADPVNPMDQSRGFGIGESDMKIAVPLAHAGFYTGANSLLEFVYVPLFDPIRMEEAGHRWSLFPDGVDITDERPDMSLANTQGGVRFTFSAGPADLGFLYFSGFMQEQGFDISGYYPPLSMFDIIFVYTRYNLFSAEAAVAAGPFTLRAEVGYNLTEDISGDDTLKYNNRIAYLAGFDVTIPKTELFLLVQVLGDYTLKTDGLSATDVDLVSGYGHPSHLTTLTASVEYPMLRQKMNLRLSGIYMVEAEGYYLSPELAFHLSDDLQFRAAGAVYGGRNEPFSVIHIWDGNDYVEMGLSYSF